MADAFSLDMSERPDTRRGSRPLRVLQRLSWLAALPATEIEPLAHSCRELSFGAGTTLAWPDQPANRVHLVVEGEVTVTAFPCPAIGLVEVLAAAPGVSLVTRTEAVILELGADDLHQALMASRPLLLAMVRGLARASLELPVPPLCPSEPSLVGSADGDGAARLGMNTTRVESGTPLWHEGDPSGYGVVVLAGEVMTRERTRDRVGRARPGSSLGLREALAGLPRWHDAIAVADTVLLRADADAMLAVLSGPGELAGYTAKAIAGGLLRAHREAA